MAGTIRGKIEAFIAEDDEFLQAGVIFKNIYNYLTAHPTTTLVSLGYGAGSGTDYPDGANPFGNDAHFVFRFDPAGGRSWPFYMFFTVGGITGSFISTNVLINGSTPSSGNGHVMSSAAVGIGGDENPYNGTQVADGTDTKPTQIWANPAGGTNVLVIPASNSTSGSHGINKNNCLTLYNESQPNNTARYHIVGDDDGVSFFWDQTDNGVVELAHFRVPVPNSRLTYNRPLYGFYRSGALINSAIGVNFCGVTAVDTAEASWQVSNMQIGWPSVVDSDFQPNSEFGGYDAFPTMVAATQAAVAGVRGTDDFMRVVLGLPGRTLNEDRTLYVTGQMGATVTNALLPWDGTTTPVSGTTRGGVDFTRAP